VVCRSLTASLSSDPTTHTDALESTETPPWLLPSHHPRRGVSCPSGSRHDPSRVHLLTSILGTWSPEDCICPAYVGMAPKDSAQVRNHNARGYRCRWQLLQRFAIAATGADTGILLRSKAQPCFKLSTPDGRWIYVPKTSLSNTLHAYARRWMSITRAG
jgi:hypothetical protein